MLMKVLGRSLLVALVFASMGVAKSSACAFCDMMSRFSKTNQTTSPYDEPSGVNGTNTGPKPNAGQPALAKAPAASNVVTQFNDLKAGGLNSVAPGSARLSSSAGVEGRVVASAEPVEVSTPGLAGLSAHGADIGLVGLAAAAGVFCWRTRRVSGSTR